MKIKKFMGIVLGAALLLQTAALPVFADSFEDSVIIGNQDTTEISGLLQRKNADYDVVELASAPGYNLNWNVNNGAFPATRSVVEATESEPKHLKWNLTSTSGKGIVYFQKGNWNLADIKDTGYVRFTFRANRELTTFDLWFRSANWKETKEHINLAGYTQKDQWVRVDIPISYFTGDVPHWDTSGQKVNFETIQEFFIEYGGGSTETVIDIAEFGIYVCPAQISFKSSEMDSTTGKYSVVLSADKPLDSNTVSSAIFKIDGTEAEAAVYNPEDYTMKLTFDMMPAFPSDKIVTVTGSMQDATGCFISPNPVKINVVNSMVQQTASVTSIKSVSLTPESGSCKVQVKCIYDDGDKGETASVFVAVYSGKRIVSFGVSDAQSLTWKDEKEFSVTLPGAEKADKAVVYVIDDMKNFMPMAERVEYTL